jgi:hypothetical protein
LFTAETTAHVQDEDLRTSVTETNDSELSLKTELIRYTGHNRLLTDTDLGRSCKLESNVFIHFHSTYASQLQESSVHDPDNVMVDGTVKFLPLPKHQTIKTSKWHGGKYPRIQDLDTIWR